MVDHVVVVGDDAGFEAFDGEGEDVGYDEGVGGGGGGSSEH